MALDLFKLVGSIYVDADKANESLSKTDEKAEGVGSKLAKAGGAAAAFGAAAVAATGTAVKALKSQADATAQAADAVDKGSQKMGVSAETYQKLSYAADLSGTSINTLQAATKKLQASGSDLDISGALDQLYAIEDADARAAAAHEMFGDKIANELAPMLNAGKEGFTAMTDEAERLGMVMSDDAVKNGAAYTDAMDALNGSIDAVKNTIGNAAIPIFTTMAKILTDNMPLIQDIIQQMVPIVQQFLESLIPIIEALLPSVISMLPSIIKLLDAVLPLLVMVTENVLPYLVKIIESLIPVIENVVNFITSVFAGDWQSAWDSIVGIFSSVWETMKAIFTEPINFIIDGLNKFITYLNKIQIPDWVPGVGGKGLNLPQIPKLKVGIDYVPSDNYPALLHKGEQVLTAEEAVRYKNSGAGSDQLAAAVRELVEMFKNGTAKTDANITNTRELRAAYAT